ncbi:extracellular solute-binding protein [Nonomuraea ferruginea]
MLRRLAIVLAVLAASGGCAATGDDGGGESRAGSTGPITFATGRDTTAYLQPLLDRWNQAHPAEKVTLIELPEAADEQRAQMVANLQARSTRYDVLGLDVVWTAEFAENGWIIPLERGSFPLDKFLPPVVKTAIYKDKLWAVPYTSNAGLLYYRTDLVKKPPRTWAELREQTQKITKKSTI